MIYRTWINITLLFVAGFVGVTTTPALSAVLIFAAIINFVIFVLDGQ